MKRKKLWIVHQDKRYPLSVGNLVETLQGAGIATELAIEISRQTEKALQEDGQKNVKLKQVLQRIAKRLQKEVDNETVERFLAQTPPFVPISVERISTDETEDSSIVAFSRRLLANSLEKLSISFKEANKIAIQIEQQLRTQGYEKVGERELVHMVAVALEATYGRDLRLRYEQQLSNPISLQISKEDKVIPFSQGILASSLMMIGLEPVEAHSFAKQCEDRLWQKGLFRVSKQGLRKEVRDLLDAELGSTFARRYDLMKNVRNMPRTGARLPFSDGNTLCLNHR